MEIANLIESRRTIHKYKKTQISDEIFYECLRLALLAPNHKWTYPWQFVDLGTKALDQVAELANQLKSASKPLSERERLETLEKYHSSAKLLAVLQKRSANVEQSREDYASVAMGLQNMALYLWEKGYGTKWSTGGITRHPELYKICRVDILTHEIVGLFWVGVPELIPPLRPRPPIEEVLSKVP